MPISTPVVVNSPTYNEYLDLYDKYEQSLECPCSSIAVPYSSFMEINISFHQICSSVYVGSVWPRIIYSSISWQLVKSPFDFRTIGPQVFQIIASFCQLANDSINNGLILYSSQQLISNNIIQKNIFSQKKNASLNLFLKTMERYLYYSNFVCLTINYAINSVAVQIDCTSLEYSNLKEENHKIIERVKMLER
jgi:hypothetical protein